MNPVPDDDADRNETSTERLDRNWASLLQELRVVQTGVQILTGLMLTIPFQQRFTELSTAQQDLYLVSLVFAVLAVVTLISPVALHRLLFRRHAVAELVDRSHWLTLIGLVCLGLAMTGVLVLIFDVVAGTGAAVAAGIVALIVFAIMWIILPLRERQKSGKGPRTE
ncbi:DUF6328 family protein [Gordonia sp. CPCC 205515]|uniref:DUF6328 family protein n=1 Tax=Gordonia sp. CPCC 205515 TaxID=3140791 RepID=UPI003AF3AAB0